MPPESICIASNTTVGQGSFAGWQPAAAARTKPGARAWQGVPAAEGGLQPEPSPDRLGQRAATAAKPAGHYPARPRPGTPRTAQGPKPLLLSTVTTDDLAILLSWSDKNTSQVPGAEAARRDCHAPRGGGVSSSPPPRDVCAAGCAAGQPGSPRFWHAAVVHAMAWCASPSLLSPPHPPPSPPQAHSTPHLPTAPPPQHTRTHTHTHPSPPHAHQPFPRWSLARIRWCWCAAWTAWTAYHRACATPTLWC